MDAELELEGRTYVHAARLPLVSEVELSGGRGLPWRFVLAV
jgi:hypothetical protein